MPGKTVNVALIGSKFMGRAQIRKGGESTMIAELCQHRARVLRGTSHRKTGGRNMVINEQVELSFEERNLMQAAIDYGLAYNAAFKKARTHEELVKIRQDRNRNSMEGGGTSRQR